MKRFLGLLGGLLLAACSAMIPYKDQNLDYLQGIEKDPAAYRGQVVSFGGEVKGITEDALRLRLVLKIDAPLYYYATGKGDSLSYELLLATFNKRSMPQMTGIKKGHTLKVLARVSGYEKRKNFTSKDIAVLHLLAFALADRTTGKDVFRPESPEKQLYDSWKVGRLFYEDSAQDIIRRYPPKQPVQWKGGALPPAPAPAPKEPAEGIVFDPEDPPFILPKSPEENVAQEPEETPLDDVSKTAGPVPAAEPAPAQMQVLNEPVPAAAAARPETEQTVPTDQALQTEALPIDSAQTASVPTETIPTEAAPAVPGNSLPPAPKAEVPTAPQKL